MSNGLLARLRHRTDSSPPAILDRIIEAAALIATADGSRTSPVSRPEVTEAVRLLRQIGDLRRRDLNRALDRFDTLAAEIRARPDEVRSNLLGHLESLAGHPARARLVLGIARAIACADETFTEPEQAMLQAIARAMAIGAD